MTEGWRLNCWRLNWEDSGWGGIDTESYCDLLLVIYSLIYPDPVVTEPALESHFHTTEARGLACLFLVMFKATLNASGECGDSA